MAKNGPTRFPLDLRGQALEHDRDDDRDRGGEHGRAAADGDRDGEGEQGGAGDQQVARGAVGEEQLELHLDTEREREQRIRGCRSAGHGTGKPIRAGARRGGDQIAAAPSTIASIAIAPRARATDTR